MKRRYAAYGMMLLLVTMIVTMCHGPTEPTGNSCNGDSLSMANWDIRERGNDLMRLY